jgi:hypothetical protein
MVLAIGRQSETVELSKSSRSASDPASRAGRSITALDPRNAGSKCKISRNSNSQLGSAVGNRPVELIQDLGNRHGTLP